MKKSIIFMHHRVVPKLHNFCFFLSAEHEIRCFKQYLSVFVHTVKVNGIQCFGPHCLALYEKKTF